MKKLLILTLCLVPIGAFADDHGPDAGRLPSQGLEIGGKGADGNFHFLSLDNTGAINTVSSSVNTITTATPSGVTASTVSSTILAANSSRKDAVIVNYGLAGCFLSRGATAVAGQGIYLAPSGGAYSIDSNNQYKGIITGITSSGTTTLSISEGQ